jgi:hypothetical protein
MTDNNLTYIEIYPKIFVYKNLFKDISKTTSLLKEEDEDGLFSPWSQWAAFGQYINPLFKDHHHTMSMEYIANEVGATTEKQQEQKDAILEVFKNFHLATKDYIDKNNVDFDEEATVKDEDGVSRKLWTTNGPSIARYRTDIEDSIGLVYHSDYVREPTKSPGNKFVITALTYFNDDYEGGEIDFVVGKEAYMYKPEAGDVLVFPSGHPDILTKDGKVYLHGVMVPRKENKYISRMYWMKYEDGSEEWYEKENHFGKDVWKEMQKEIIDNFWAGIPPRKSAGEVRRIK